jgi:hypothetical protein
VAASIRCHSVHLIPRHHQFHRLLPTEIAACHHVDCCNGPYIKPRLLPPRGPSDFDADSRSRESSSLSVAGTFISRLSSPAQHRYRNGRSTLLLPTLLVCQHFPLPAAMILVRQCPAQPLHFPPPGPRLAGRVGSGPAPFEACDLSGPSKLLLCWLLSRPVLILSYMPETHLALPLHADGTNLGSVPSHPPRPPGLALSSLSLTCAAQHCTALMHHAAFCCHCVATSFLCLSFSDSCLLDF